MVCQRQFKMTASSPVSTTAPTTGLDVRTHYHPGRRILGGGGFADSAGDLNRSLRHAERRDRRFRWNELRLTRNDHPPLAESR